MAKLRTLFRTAAQTSSASAKKSGPAKIIPITTGKPNPQPVRAMKLISSKNSNAADSL
jgi:hypothetical protein